MTYTALERFFTLLGGMAVIASIGLRISYKVGCMVTLFETHVLASNRIHEDQDADIRELRARRR